MTFAAQDDPTSFADERSGLNDPLLVFDSERSAPASPTKGTAFDTADLDMTASPAATSRPADRSRPHARGQDWLVGTLILSVGLVAGYAAGIGIGDRPADRVNGSGSMASTNTEPKPPVAESAASSAPVIAPADDSNERPVSESSGVIPPSETNLPSRQSTPSPTGTTSPTSALGALHVVSRPAGAQVYLNDRLVATTPFRLYEVPPGSHTVRMELDGHQPWSASVDVAEGALVRISASLE